MTDPKRLQAISDRAHRLWEEDGRPDGKDAEHWARAEAEMEAQMEAGDKAPRPASEHPSAAESGDTMESSIAGTDAAKPARTPRKRAPK